MATHSLNNDHLNRTHFTFFFYIFFSKIYFIRIKCWSQTRSHLLGGRHFFKEITFCIWRFFLCCYSLFSFFLCSHSKWVICIILLLFHNFCIFFLDTTIYSVFWVCVCMIFYHTFIRFDRYSLVCALSHSHHIHFYWLVHTTFILVIESNINNKTKYSIRLECHKRAKLCDNVRTFNWINVLTEILIVSKNT